MKKAIRVYMTQLEHDALEARARAARTSMSDLARTYIVACLQTREEVFKSPQYVEDSLATTRTLKTTERFSLSPEPDTLNKDLLLPAPTKEPIVETTPKDVFDILEKGEDDAI